MRITKLEAAGVKAPGRTDHKLSPVTVITGDNFAGKTARLDALRLGLIGYLPELGKRPSDTFKLAADGEMSVGLTFEDGSRIERSWKQAKGTVKLTSSGDVSVPVVLIDPSEYFSLGDKDRVRYVFKLAAAHIDGAADSVISKLKTIKIEGHSPAHEAAIDELVNMVDETDRERHESDKPVPQWLEELIASVREQHKATKGEVDRMSKTVGGMAVIDCQDDEETARNVSQELTAKREQLAAMQSGIGAMTERVRAATAAASKRKELEDLLENTPDPSADLADMGAKYAALAAQGARKRLALEAQQAVTKASTAEAKARAVWETARKAIEQAKDELAQKKAHDSCPFCGANGEGWLDHLLAEYEKKISDLRWDAGEKEDAVKKAVRCLKLAQADLTKATEHDAQLEKANREALDLHGKVTRLSAQVSTRQAALSTLANLPPAEPADETKLNALRREADMLGGEIARLTVRHEKFIQQQQALVLAAKAEQRMAETKAKAAVEAEAVKMLEALQAAMVQQAFGSILETANKLTAGILKTPLEYREGEIGRAQDGVWIPHQAFSGTEKALAYAGISVAMAAQSPVKIVLLDEMGRLTPANKIKVGCRLVELVEKKVIDQAVCVDVNAADYPANLGVISVIKV